MKVLIAEDDAVSRRVLQVTLERLGHDVVTTENGEEALLAMQVDPIPRMAVLDWMMPGVDGIEVCRKLRARYRAGYVYILLLTAKGQREDILAGFEAGADDYLTKPFNPNELRSRLQVGERILDLQGKLEEKVAELETAMAHVKTLQGLLPICMFCKKIRDDHNTWHKLEKYLSDHADVMFSHSCCDDCRREHYPSPPPS